MSDPSDDVRLSHGVPYTLSVVSDVGRIRTNNEDSHGVCWLEDGSLLVIVADGMGGHEAGEVASSLAVEVLEERVDAVGRQPQRQLYEALLDANEAILAASREAGRRGMGTTAVVALVRGSTCHAGLVGDSRLYHVRAGTVIERTVDHTRVQSLLDMGLISEAEAREHPEAGMLTRALGHARMSNGQPLEPEVFAQPLALLEGDALVLCSDGLHDLVADWEIANVVAGTSAAAAAQALVDLALDRGGHDNVTVAVVIAGTYAAAYVPRREQAATRPPPPITVPPGQGSAPPAPPAARGASPVPESEAPRARDDRTLLILAFAGMVLLFLAAMLMVAALVLSTS